MIAYRSLIKFLLAKGLKVVVWDGEEWAVKAKVGKPSKFNEIVDAIKAVEEAEILVLAEKHGPSLPGERLGHAKVPGGWAYIIVPGPGAVSDEESVADWSVGGVIDEWWEGPDGFFAKHC